MNDYCSDPLIHQFLETMDHMAEEKKKHASIVKQYGIQFTIETEYAINASSNTSLADLPLKNIINFIVFLS